ncbi:unnamed protein product [Paramecium sonneborni]|uniref:Uncharacterized protein n=1 Tax=Paramecium sonneborni TaxID=65129 RepID=A0A8S1PMC9_9CILI|nr:unnamed protein product [Paramecium sonneborni]
MGIRCSQPQNSMLIFSTLRSFDEKEQQKHSTSLTLNYGFPQKQILETNKTKIQLEIEQNHPQQPVDPGSPMQAISEHTWEGCEFTKVHHTCPTNNRINRLYSNSISFQHNKTLSNKKINYSPPIFMNKTNQTIKGIIKKSRYNSDSQSPNSSQTIKSVRFLVTEQVRLQRKFMRTRSLCKKQSSRRQNSSTIYSNCDQSFQYNIEF